MAELLGAVSKATSSFLELKEVSIDNWGFKLFYKFSTTILVFCSVLVSARSVASLSMNVPKIFNCSGNSLESQFSVMLDL